ncbi:MAG: hypothetical protein L6244_01325 [Candidatus Methanoperedenaceae archaeon]|nr:hypothetical protein [Candidatus Methanoperedenaceae archaeon]
MRPQTPLYAPPLAGDAYAFSRLPNFSRHILTPERVKVLQTIRESAPQSISEPAFLLGRDRRNVIHDLTYLNGSGFVDFEDENKAKKAKKPIVDYDAVHVTIPISKGSAISA